MNSLNKTEKIWIAIVVGAIWGLAEALVGMYMRQTVAYGMTGSIMTGIVALLLAFGYGAIRQSGLLFISLAMVVLFKLLDAWLLHLPVVHGAVGNPIFAIILEVLALCLVVNIIRPELKSKLYGQALIGALYALIAVTAFPVDESMIISGQNRLVIRKVEMNKTDSTVLHVWNLIRYNAIQ